MIAYDSTLMSQGEKNYCAFAGRRIDKEYVYSEQDIIDKFGSHLKKVGKVPHALSGAMGDIMFLANFRTKEELDEFYKEVTAQKQTVAA
jgi:uncharacterized protein (DUF1330 family)